MVSLLFLSGYCTLNSHISSMPQFDRRRINKLSRLLRDRRDTSNDEFVFVGLASSPERKNKLGGVGRYTRWKMLIGRRSFPFMLNFQGLRISFTMVVVSIFFLEPWGKWSNLMFIFSMDWHHLTFTVFIFQWHVDCFGMVLGRQFLWLSELCHETSPHGKMIVTRMRCIMVKVRA